MKVNYTLIILTCFFGFESCKTLDKLSPPAVKPGYYKEITSVEPLERTYTTIGGQSVKTFEKLSGQEKFSKYKIWYPRVMENKDSKKYPVVIFANGTGVPYTKYEPAFEHLASWGFIVVGNDDPASGDGRSSSLSFDLISSLNGDRSSIFYLKVDLDNVGIGGHSQGGVGAIRAITDYKNGTHYKSIYTASATSLSMIKAWNLKGWEYNLSTLRIPYFMVAGTGNTDANTIAPLSSLLDNFENTRSGKLTVMARRKNTDHGQMLSKADGYMTAWFRFTLMGDKKAGNVFTGFRPEILDNNTNWQDVKIK